MTAKINHVAIISDNYTLLGKFYEGVFGMKTARKTRPLRAVTVSDGYVGLNINPRAAGRPARLDHFGIEVEDMEQTFARLRERYPAIEWLQRPTTRPFAAITTHDPDGNVFDLSQKDLSNRREVYSEGGWEQERSISHLGVRTLRPEAMAQFYAEIFGFAVLNKQAGDPNHYVSDGRVTLELMPWHITDYAGTGIVSPALDHIGFTVESVAALERDLAELAEINNPAIQPRPMSAGPEGIARLELFRKSCPLGSLHLADPDGILIDAAE